MPDIYVGTVEEPIDFSATTDLEWLRKAIVPDDVPAGISAIAKRTRTVIELQD